MSMNPKHGHTVPFVVVPHSNDAVLASLSRGQQCCVAIESQCRNLEDTQTEDAKCFVLNAEENTCSPLLVDAVPIIRVESPEMKASSSLRRCLCLPCSLSSAALCGTSNTLQLDVSGTLSITEIQKRHFYAIQVQTGRKWRAEKAL